MAKIDMKATVIATLDSDADDGVAFRLEDEEGTELESLVFDKGKFHGMKKSDVHVVRFKLVQEKGMTLEFAQGKDVALWVAQGTDQTIPDCPTSQPSQPNPIFYGDKSNGNTLTAINTNPCECFFNFSLNFVDPKSTTPTKLIRYDPVGENKNNGIDDRGSEFSTFALVIGIGAVAVLGFLVYQAFLD